jgi:hypothetical protein
MFTVRAAKAQESVREYATLEEGFEFLGDM